MLSSTDPIVYQGQFGNFTILESDRREVIFYRGGLMLAAVCFAISTGLVLWQGNNFTSLHWVSGLYSIFCVGLGVSLWMIHIYLKPLHQALQVFWLVGVVASIAIAHNSPEPFALTVYTYPLTILGVGFVFAALTGIFFKEAVCFNRLEAKVLTPLVPLLLLGHLLNWLSPEVERGLLVSWAILFGVFAFRKVIQPIPPDIGDKSVFDYLKSGAQKQSV
ncbi:DUF2301 domain-containing membrane protein [Phormidium sp. CLA17]|uniref:DUF2301 domain-containing membrane protein n=1 Tax=Leptolyngbya sp. Cla-17 TaxID=2803751 RepID=UPI0014919A13|nr:DUF2301 domain-containing membrane protein [Leptolyngbya sp. Cla-17]MBM0743343.1 DUF2301 domain-containing membrane protein [Leptolyngbya sp. Cla-17]